MYVRYVHATKLVLKYDTVLLRFKKLNVENAVSGALDVKHVDVATVYSVPKKGAALLIRAVSRYFENPCKSSTFYLFFFFKRTPPF